MSNGVICASVRLPTIRNTTSRTAYIATPRSTLHGYGYTSIRIVSGASPGTPIPPCTRPMERGVK